MKKTWAIWFWVNQPEYQTCVCVKAERIERIDESVFVADGLMISTPEPITRIEETAMFGVQIKG